MNVVLKKGDVMFNHIVRFVKVALYGLLLFYVSGCVPLMVGAAAGAGGIVWVKGTLRQDIDRPLDEVYEASKNALKDLDLPILLDRMDQLSAILESETADKQRVWIKMKHVSSKITRLSVRVGALGDEVKSREILQTIVDDLER